MKKISVWILALCLALGCAPAQAEPDAASLLQTAVAALARSESVRVEATVSMGIENVLPSGVYANGTLDALRDPPQCKAVAESRGERAEAYLRQEGEGSLLRVRMGDAWRDSALKLNPDAALKSLADADYAAAAQALFAQVDGEETIGGVAAYKLLIKPDLRKLLGDGAVEAGLAAVLGEQANMQALPQGWMAVAEVTLYVAQDTGRPLRMVVDVSRAASDAAARLMPVTPGAQAQPMKISLVLQADFVRYDAVEAFEWPEIPA